MDKVKKALVLGGQSGLLGQALVTVLKEQGYDVACLGRNHVNILDYADMSDEIERVEPDIVFNTFAYTQVDLAEEQPDEAMRINREVPLIIGRVLKASQIPLVHYSTDFVFDGCKKTPYLVTDSPCPASVYGRAKLAGERALQELGLSKCCIVRTAWLFGPGRKNFVETILKHAQTEPVLKVVHDQVGCPSYTLDVAKASLELINAKAEGLFHLVNSGHASWCELAAEAVRLANLPCTVQAISSSDWPQKAKRPSYSVLDTSAYTDVTGLSMRPWVNALREYIYQYFLK